MHKTQSKAGGGSALTALLLLAAGAVHADSLELAATLTAEERDYYDFLAFNSEDYFRQHLKGPQDRADGSTLNPKFQYHLEKYPRAAEQNASLADLVVTPEQRVEYRWLTDRVWNKRSYESRAMKSVDERYIMGPGGPLRIRTYVPQTDAPPGTPLPLVLYFHGGGWLTGSVVAVDPAVRLLANEAQAIVVSADYRLTPEFTFPAAHDDGVAVYRWVREHARELGGDPRKLGVSGDSAGGHMAIVTTMRIIDAKEPPPAYLLLYYPVTDLDGAKYPSWKSFRSNFGLNEDAMDYFKRTYFPNAADHKNKYASPMAAASLRGMPPTIVVTPGFDLLRDQGKAFADKLQRDGVDVTYLNYGTLIHGFMQHTYAVEEALVASIESARLFGKNLRALN